MLQHPGNYTGLGALYQEIRMEINLYFLLYNITIRKLKISVRMRDMELRFGFFPERIYRVGRNPLLKQQLSL